MYETREDGVHPKDSPHKGIAHIRLGGKDYRLRYDWEAIEKVQTMFLGTQDLNKPRDLSEIIAIGLEAFHPDALTADEIMKFSEPLVPTAERVATALAYGLGTHPALSQPEKPENPQKPNRNARRALAAHTKRQSESESELVNSGP